ncbi:MAG: DUF4434 domain-containing protein [Eubacteriales bacterium]
MLAGFFKSVVSYVLAIVAVISIFSNFLCKQELPEAEHPTVSGTFMQAWAFAGFSEEEIGRHFDNLLEVGIDTAILQSTASTPNGLFENVYYPSALAEQNPAEGSVSGYKGFVERCLAAAEARGMKIFLGLNVADEWWSKFVKDKKWYTMQAELGNQIANEMYGLYKEKYPNAMHGWYFTWEFSNAIWPYEYQCADMLNINLDFLTKLDPSMPLMLSPFIGSDISPLQTQISCVKLFSLTRFRPGDIYCCQDSVGAGYIKLDELDKYFSAIKNAVDTKHGLAFWANNENFVQANWSSAPISRFVTQMKISSKYVENHVTFSYSHYYSLDMGKQAYHDAYKRYYLTGEIVDPV